MSAPTPAVLANQMSSLIDNWRIYMGQLKDWLAGSPTGGPNSDGKYPLTDSLGTTYYVACPAAMEATVAGPVGTAEEYAGDALAASLVASGARVDALAAQAVTLTYRDAAVAARDLASTYASAAGTHAANALLYKNQAQAAASSTTSSEAAVLAAAIEVEADRVAADAARVAAQTAAAAAATFDPANFYTKTAADARYRQLSVPITWTELTGKPSSFTPTSHTHAWGDITTGKPTTLAGYGITDPVWTSSNFNPATKQSARTELDAAARTISDWNDATNNGWYMASGAANAPVAGNWFMGRVSQHNGDWIQQELWDFTLDAQAIRYRRHKMSGVWSAWTEKLFIGAHTYTGNWPINESYSGLHRNDNSYIIMGGSTDAMTYVGAGANGDVVIRANANDTTKELRVRGSDGMVVAQGDLSVKNAFVRDITASRGDGTGVIFLNAAQNKYLYWDNTKYIMPGGNLSVGGSLLADADVRGASLYPTGANGAYFSGNGGGIQANGHFYTTTSHQLLNALGSGWVRNPRIFIGGSDPGTLASDGDIWIP